MFFFWWCKSRSKFKSKGNCLVGDALKHFFFTPIPLGDDTMDSIYQLAASTDSLGHLPAILSYNSARLDGQKGGYCACYKPSLMWLVISCKFFKMETKHPGDSAIVTFLGWWKRDPFKGWIVTSNVWGWKGHELNHLDGHQWSFLVPLIGGRYHIIPQLAVYTTYIPLICCQTWCFFHNITNLVNYAR